MFGEEIREERTHRDQTDADDADGRLDDGPDISVGYNI